MPHISAAPAWAGIHACLGFRPQAPGIAVTLPSRMLHGWEQAFGRISLIPSRSALLQISLE